MFGLHRPVPETYPLRYAEVNQREGSGANPEIQMILFRLTPTACSTPFRERFGAWA